ncbi:Eyes absent-like protein 4 [Hordeum vulgare]|nr:Eyes absent-like protein 4 [Hordeum vulgare]
MRDEVGLDLDGFPLDHEFPEDYGLEEEGERDIEAEPLFEDELANQADGTKLKCKSKQTKAYTAAEDKLLCECWRDIGQDPKMGAEQNHLSFWIRVHREFHERKKFPQYQIEKFKAQYAALKSRGGKQAVEAVGDGEKARPRGKNNSKKEDKRDAASIALIATLEGMITKKDSREEKRRQEREEQMNAFLKIQRRRLDMEAEKQAQMLEMEVEKQAKMLEIEAANAKTKAKEVALVSMMTRVEIMKVDLNTVSSRKRPWFEKMQADMLKFDEE